VIAATDDRPPTANRSWLGISLIDSLKESDTPQLRLTERYCVVAQTLATSPQLSVSLAHFGTGERGD